MRVAFRLDASRSVGLGHLSRSSNLARALEQRGAHVSFVVGGEGGVELSRTWLPPSMPVSPAGADQDDLPTLVAHVEQAGADVVIVDHYGLSSSYLRALRASVGALVILDDLGDRDLTAADLVVNTTPAGMLVDYPASLAPRLLRGDYVLLHPAFAQSRKESSAAGERRRVLVVLGGTDASARLDEALVIVRARFPRAELRAVLGVPREGQRSRVGEARYYAEPPEAMAAHAAWAELAIASASTLAWELAAVGTPAILCRVAENQGPTARFFRELEAFPVLEGIDGLDAALRAIEGLSSEERETRARRFASVCDGEGAARLADHLVTSWYPSRRP